MTKCVVFLSVIYHMFYVVSLEILICYEIESHIARLISAAAALTVDHLARQGQPPSQVSGSAQENGRGLHACEAWLLVSIRGEHGRRPGSLQGCYPQAGLQCKSVTSRIFFLHLS